MQHNDMNKLHTTDSAAAFLGVTPARVRQLIMQNRLKSQKFGRDHMISGSELRAYTSKRRRKPGRPPK